MKGFLKFLHFFELFDNKARQLFLSFFLLLGLLGQYLSIHQRHFIGKLSAVCCWLHLCQTKDDEQR
jgi:hypothetical protein